MFTNNINQRFADVPGLKTAKGAQSRLDKFTSGFENSGAACFSTLILTKDDGSFIPVILPNQNHQYLCAGIVAHNICALCV